VTFLSLQFRVNKTTPSSFQQIHQTAPEVQWHPIVSYGLQNECEIMCVLLGTTDSSLRIPPTRSPALSFSVRTPCKSLFSVEGSLWKLSCPFHSRHLQGCVFLEHKEVLSGFGSLSVYSQQALAFLKKSRNICSNILSFWV